MSPRSLLTTARGEKFQIQLTKAEAIPNDKRNSKRDIDL